ncbi:hypothetical protein B5G12_13865 [Faecalibacterium sp. An58]|nr:hypothetical protein B5G12_13865 [Faecalibacterium sp. An58]
MRLKDAADAVNYARIGKRVKLARVEKDLTQAGLARLVGCTNNYISHIEVAQTRVSLGVLMQIAKVLEKDLDFFLLDTPYVSRAKRIDLEIADKLNKCDPPMLLAVSKILDALLDCQHTLSTEPKDTPSEAPVEKPE